MTHFTDEGKRHILEGFNALGDQEKQDIHIMGCIRSLEVQRRRPSNTENPSSERKAHHIYKVCFPDLLIKCVFVKHTSWYADNMNYVEYLQRSTD